MTPAQLLIVVVLAGVVYAARGLCGPRPDCRECAPWLYPEECDRDF